MEKKAKVTHCYGTMYCSVAFTLFDDGSMKPYYPHGIALLPSEWETLIDGVNKYYASHPTERIIQHNEMVERREIAAHEGAMQGRHIRRSQEGWVYVLRAGEYYKIGRSKTPKQRYEELATLPPWPTEMVHTIETKDRCQLEAELHSKFADKRKRGEWFELDEEDVTWLKTL